MQSRRRTEKERIKTVHNVELIRGNYLLADIVVIVCLFIGDKDVHISDFFN